MSGAYLGDFPTSAVVYIPFDTFAGSTGASITMTGFVAGDILIYKNGSVTQRTSSSGITVSTDFDAQTGLHLITIDTSDNTDAGFYAAGGEYIVGVADVTIDAQTVRFWAGMFSLERSGGALALLKHASYGLAQLVRSTTPANTLDVAATGEAGLDFNNVKDATGAHTLTNIRVPNVTLVDTLTTYTGNTVQTGDSFARIGAAGVSLSAVPDEAGVTTLLSRLSAARAGYLDNVNNAGLQTTVAQTGDSFARIGAAGISLSAIPDLAGVTTLLARLSAARAGYLDNINNGTLAGAVFPTDPADESLIIAATDALAVLSNAIKAKTDSLTFTAANLVDANVLRFASVAAGATNIDRSTRGIVLGTVGAASTTTSIVTSALDPAAAVTDQFKGRIVTFDRGTTTTNLRGQATDITASTAGGVLTVTALTTAPVSGDTFVIT